MNKIKSVCVLLGVFFTLSSLAHEPEVTRESICETKNDQVYFLKVYGADFGEPEIGNRYVKIWRERDSFGFLSNIFSIEDPLDRGGLNGGLCTCSLEDKPKLTCD